MGSMGSMVSMVSMVATVSVPALMPALVLAVGSCFSERTDYRPGELACHHVDDSCPPNLVCAFDHKCYPSGQVPGMPDARICRPDAPGVLCGTRVCGTVRDECGTDHSCGTCSGSELCDANGACVQTCVPLTECPTGDECGTVDPGCGQPLLTCGAACPIERPTCTSNKCVCAPLATCPAGVCGTYPNGCGGNLQCGDCSSTNQICDTSMSLCRDKTQAEACAGFTCGAPMSGSQTYSCGTCSGPDVCSSPSGGACVCTPVDPCAGKNCGTVVDNCDNTVDCDPGHTCQIGLCYECDLNICTFRTQCQ